MWQKNVNMPSANDEHKLIQALIKGDALAFDAIFSKYNKRVYTFSYRNLKSKENAEEIVQDVFLSLWNEREKLKKVEKLDAWIFAICFNIIRKHFRQLAQERKYLQNIAPYLHEKDDATVSEVEYHDLMEKAEQVIDRLPQRQKEIFIMHKREGFSNEEISRKMNISKKTVENYLSSARVLIKKSLVGEGLLSLLFFWFFVK